MAVRALNYKSKNTLMVEQRTLYGGFDSAQPPAGETAQPLAFSHHRSGSVILVNIGD